MARKIILDVDTGSDDAVAIMAAILSPEIELVAACSVAGNNPIDATTENTLRVIEAMGADVPVYRGASEPLLKHLAPGRLAPTPRSNVELEHDDRIIKMHDEYLDLPGATVKEQDMPAAMFYVEYLRNATEPVTLVPVGPLTNLAIALMMDPTIVKNIAEIVIMGGGYKVTNASSSSEFNIFFDPEAALWVLRSGAKITWVPLDATHKAYLTLDDCLAFRALGTLAGDFAAALIEQRIFVHTHLQPLDVPDSAAVHDALAVCYLLDPSVLKDVRHVHMDIGLTDYSDGQTIVDPRFHPEERNCWFAFDGDPVKFSRMLQDLFKRGPKA
ncbi:MAG: nucleoside hydrolase [Oscillospiraceae bacterium]|nr:nucleoside hydrolase [Oscillospiraceae bacterium]